MKIKRYFAPDTRHAMRQIRSEQGPNAVILCCRSVAGGTEVITAVDPEHVIRPPPAIKPTIQPPVVRPAVASMPAPANSAEIHAIHRELHAMHGLLDDRFARLAEIDFKRRRPLEAALIGKLTKQGYSRVLLKELAQNLPLKHPQQAWHELLVRLAGRILVTDDDILSHGGQVALLGPSGTGKTSTIAKLAARFMLRHGPHSVGLLCNDYNRIGGLQQLQRYAQLLQVPLRSARTARDLTRALGDLAKRQLVLIDTAGLGQHHPRIAKQLAALQSIPNLKRYLVVSMTMSAAVFEQVLARYRQGGLSGAILTHLDEAARPGAILSSLIQHRLPIAYLGNGMRIPEDLSPARSGKLVAASITAGHRPEQIATTAMQELRNHA